MVKLIKKPSMLPELRHEVNAIGLNDNLLKISRNMAGGFGALPLPFSGVTTISGRTA